MLRSTIISGLLLLTASSMWAQVTYYNFTSGRSGGDLTGSVIGTTAYNQMFITSNGVEAVYDRVPEGQATGQVTLGGSSFTGTLPSGSAGSGQFTELFSVQDNNDSDSIAQGYNVAADNKSDPEGDSAPPQINDIPWDTQGGNSGDPALGMWQLHIVSVDGTDYFQFLYDGHQSSDVISLDSLIIIQASNQAANNNNILIPNTGTGNGDTPNPTPGQLLTKFLADDATGTASIRYSLDDYSGDTVTTDRSIIMANGGGGGSLDASVLIPISAFDISNFYQTRIYLYSSFGEQGSSFDIGGGTIFDLGDNSTPEEWALIRGSGSNNLVPEPGTVTTGIFLCIFLGGGVAWKCFKRHVPRA